MVCIIYSTCQNRNLTAFTVSTGFKFLVISQRTTSIPASFLNAISFISPITLYVVKLLKRRYFNQFSSGLHFLEGRDALVKLLFGIFILLHGVVHGLYFGQSAGIFELKPGMTWPLKSWAVSKLLGDAAARNIASISMLLAALLLAAGGIGIFAGQPWWRPVVVGAAIFSTLVYILFWNGKVQNLDGQGGIGLIINLLLLLAILIFHWPKLGF